MPEEDERASEVKHAREVLQIILVTRDQPTIILERCEQPLDLPSVTIATQETSILRPVRAVATMRRRLDPSMRIVPGTDCAALRYETKSPRPVPGAHARAAGLLLTGWPGGWLRH